MKDSKHSSQYIRYLPLYGCVSTGLIYLGIGVIAILSFFKLKEGGADEGSLIAYLNDFLAGKILIWIILSGTVSYIIWRFYEAITDPYEYGKDTKGITKRTGIALSTVADMMIVYSAIQILIGVSKTSPTGQPDEERQWVESLLQQHWGSWLVVAIGFIVLATAAVQFFYGITRGYKERLDISRFSSRTRRFIHLLAWIGYFARGIIIGIIGFFFVKAGMLKNASYVVNTDKAFDFIGDHVGHLFFILVALGTVCYALFMFCLGITYDAEKD